MRKIRTWEVGSKLLLDPSPTPYKQLIVAGDCNEESQSRYDMTINPSTHTHAHKLSASALHAMLVHAYVHAHV